MAIEHTRRAAIPSPGSWPDPVDKAKYAKGIIENQIINAVSYAERCLDAAFGWLTVIENTTFTIPVAVIQYDSPAPPPEIALDTIQRPVLDEYAPVNVDEPSEPLFVDVVVTPSDAPVFGSDKPTFDYPNRPSWDVPSFPSAPVILEPTLPTKNILPYPSAPTLNEVVFPDPPELLLIPFDGVYPVDDLTPPVVSFIYSEGEYTSALKSALDSKLLTMVGGASGLDAAVEQAILDRDDERYRLEEEAQYDEAGKYFESRGASLPDGALVARLDSVREAIARRRADRLNAIRIESFERADKILQFAISQGIVWESKVMDIVNAASQRAFEAAKLSCDYMIQGYELLRNTYLTRLEVVKIKAQVTETSARIAAAQADIYKTQMEAASIESQIQKNMIDLYMGEMQAVKISAEIYNTEIQGTLAELQIEAQKLENFKYLIDAFTAQVQAKTAEFNAYVAGMAGEGEKAKVYLTDAQVYNTEVEAFKAKTAVDVEIGRFKMEKNEFNLKAYLGMIEAMKAKVQKAIGEAEVIGKKNAELVNMYQADTGKYGEQVKYIMQRYTEVIEELKLHTQTRVTQMEKNMEALISSFQMQNDLFKAATQALSQMAAASMSSGTASVQMGYHEDVGDRTQIMKDMQQSIGAHSSDSGSDSFSESEGIQVIWYNYKEA